MWHRIDERSLRKGNIKETTVWIFRHGVVSKIYAGCSKKPEQIGNDKISWNILLKRCKDCNDRGQIIRPVTKKEKDQSRKLYVVSVNNKERKNTTSLAKIDERSVLQCYLLRKRTKFYCFCLKLRTVFFDFILTSNFHPTHRFQDVLLSYFSSCSFSSSSHRGKVKKKPPNGTQNG